MKNCFSHIYPNDMKETSDEDNVYEFYKRNLSFEENVTKLTYTLKRIMNRYPIIIEWQNQELLTAETVKVQSRIT